jgi:hypothetical protein
VSVYFINKTTELAILVRFLLTQTAFLICLVNSEVFSRKMNWRLSLALTSTSLFHSEEDKKSLQAKKTHRSSQISKARHQHATDVNLGFF